MIRNKDREARDVLKKRVRGCFLLALGLIFFMYACTAVKSRDEELKGIDKFYHNMTSEFNGYFNANELYEAAVLQLDQQYLDNYHQILPVYEYQAVADPKPIHADMDKAIEKLSVVISMHRNSNWEDQSYLLIGKSQYLKQDYESAQKTLEYFLYEFDPSRDLYENKNAVRSRDKKSRDRQQKERARERKEDMKEREAQEKARQKEREEYNKQKEEERKKRQKQVQEEKKNRVKERKQLQKEREKERQRLKKEREKEAKARAKARKKGKKRKAPPPKKGKESQKKTTAPVRDGAKPLIDPAQESEGENKANEPEDPVKEELPALEESNDELKEEEEEPIIDAPRVWDASNLPKTKDAYPEALLWMGRVYIERDMFGRAQQSFSRLEEYINIPKEVVRQLHPAKAHFYIVREQYPEAAEQLELALENEPKNYIKARYAFILAQLYYRMGNNSMAMENFELARKWAIDYDLEFSARMRMAIAAGAAGGASMTQAISDLEAMLKDDKNKGYEDRIYYQIALIYMENGNMDAAKENLLASLRFSSNNEAQKAESYFALAEIYNDEEKYVKAKAYYDSTLMVMSEKDDRHVDATRWANSLEEIAKNLQIIEQQDSLLRISALSEEEKKRLATDMVKDKLIAEAEKEARAQAAAAGLREMNFTPPQAGTNNINSNFFAYDEKTLRKGFKEFERRYGGRPLVDNWRRSSEIGGADKDPGVVEDRLIEELTQEEVDQILVGVPNSPQAEQQARTSIHNALYGLGVAFREKLYKPVESIKAFERLVREYPDSDKRVEACYYLYVNHQELDQFNKAKFYYDLIQEEYPESLYAMVLKDPEYVNTLETEERKLLNYYNQTYISFEQGNHQEVIKRVEGAAEIIPSESPYMPKMALLEAMSVGAIEGKEEYIEALRDMIANYPGTDEQVRAKEILRFIQGDANAFGKAGQLPEQDLYENFRDDFNRLHYVIVVLYNQQDVDLNAAKESINGFNRDNFKRKDLRVTNIYLDQENTIPVIIIRKFNNSSDAMDYYDTTIDLSREFLPEEADYEVFAINQRNYREVIKTHTTRAYSQYFQEKYVENR